MKNKMVISDIRWRTYRIPFAKGFSTAHGVMAAREGTIVEVLTTEDSVGVGEIAPLPEFGGGDLAEACALLPALAAQLKGKSLRTASEMLEHIELPVAATRCGMEIALLDALGKAEGRTISALLAPDSFVPRAAVYVNAVIGAGTIEETVAAAHEAKRAGFGCIKLKVGGSAGRADIARVAATREAVGPAMHLRLDANEAWSFTDAVTILEGCIPYGIQYVEQPLKAHDLAGMQALRQSLPLAIAADEAVRDIASVRRIFASEAADILVIKPQLAGGLRMTQQIVQEATEQGVRCVLTSSIESGITLMATLHLAAATPVISLECGLATSHLLVDDLLQEDVLVEHGALSVPTGTGLGITLDRRAIKQYEIEAS